MAYRSHAYGTGTSATPSVAVPSGVASGDIIILVTTIDSSAADFETGDYPSGFTELHDVNVTAEGQSVSVAWKRTSGADTGTYDFANVGASSDWICAALAFSGRHATNAPTSTSNIQNTPQVNPVTVTATGVTAVAGDDLVWISAPDVTSGPNIVTGHLPPTDFTERVDAGIDAEGALWVKLGVATRDAVSAGATGDISGTLQLNANDAGWAAFLVRIPLAAGGGGGNANVLAGKFGALLRGKLG
jgi:hypothetical protein